MGYVLCFEFLTHALLWAGEKKYANSQICSLKQHSPYGSVSWYVLSGLNGVKDLNLVVISEFLMCTDLRKNCYPGAP
jgi:hypothetical protein